jgi:hypothetical protein
MVQPKKPRQQRGAPDAKPSRHSPGKEHAKHVRVNDRKQTHEKKVSVRSPKGAK